MRKCLFEAQQSPRGWSRKGRAEQEMLLAGQVTKGRPGESLEDSEQGSDRKKLTFLRDLHGKETGGELARRASEGVA